jgi:hypothetical protein
MQSGEYQGKEYRYIKGDRFAQEYKISKDPNDLMCVTAYENIKDETLYDLLREALNGERFEDTIDPEKKGRSLEEGTVPYERLYWTIKTDPDMGTNVFKNTLYTRRESLRRRNQAKMAELYEAQPSMYSDPDYQPDFNPERAVGSQEFKDFAEGKRDDYISDKDREMLEQDEIELQVRPGRYAVDTREVKRWEKKGYQVIARLPFGKGLLVRLRKKEVVE